MPFFPEEVQFKYYQFWMDIRREKEDDAYTPLLMKSSSSRLPSLKYDTHWKPERQAVHSELVFGLSVIHERV
jgi:hypothetical protein